MVLTFLYQTDDDMATPGPSGPVEACSGIGAAQTTGDKDVSRKVGDLGSGTVSLGTNNANARRAMHWVLSLAQSDDVSQLDGTGGLKAGDFVVRFNVSTANANVDLDAIYICRVDSGGFPITGQGTYGSLTGLSDTLTEGVHTHTVPVTLNPRTPSASYVYLILSVVRTAGHGTASFELTMDQIFDTPIFPGPGTRAASRGTMRGSMRGV